jgi:Dynein heavy chain, N-terminal region 2
VQVQLVKEWRDMVTEVGDHQSLVASLCQSAHASAFQDAIAGWERRLQVLQDGLGSMAAVQRKWLYLEPVFARGALPEQAPRFQQVRTCRLRPAAMLCACFRTTSTAQVALPQACIRAARARAALPTCASTSLLHLFRCVWHWAALPSQLRCTSLQVAWQFQQQ